MVGRVRTFVLTFASCKSFDTACMIFSFRTKVYSLAYTCLSLLFPVLEEICRIKLKTYFAVTWVAFALCSRDCVSVRALCSINDGDVSRCDVDGMGPNVDADGVGPDADADGMGPNADADGGGSTGGSIAGGGR